MATTQLGNSLLKPESGWNRKYCQLDNVNTFFQGVRDKDTYPSASWSIVGGNDDPSIEQSWLTFYGPQNTNNDIFSFTFTGTSFRIMQKYYSTHRYNIKVRINGGDWIKGSVIYNSTVMFRVCFEKLDLPKGTHKVEVTYDGFTTGSNDKSNYTFLTAIDYADLSAKAGDQLLQPEPGWKRFDDTDINFQYSGAWGVNTKSDYYGGSTHYCPSNKYLATVQFQFYGTCLRIIGLASNSYDQGNIIIDNQPQETFSYKRSAAQSQSLVYEKLNLTKGFHTVVLSGTNINFDALDIDADGFLITPAKVGDVLKEPESGWKRFDDRDPNILYQGNWIKNENITTHYRGTFHNKPSSSGDDSIIKALFDFSGTKIRIISFMTTGSYDVGTIMVDGEAFNFSYIKGTPTAQCLVFEKLGLEPGVHKVELSGRYINLDAIDIDETGELIPIETKKSKVSLYEKESGKIFADDFYSVNPKWLMSPSNAFNNAVKKGFLRMNHADNKDVMLLIDKPQSNFAIQVIADYAPTKEGDEGGLLIYQNEKNKVEFLESYSANSSQSNKEWMAICKEDQWDFYTKTDTFFDYADNDSLAAKRIGVVLKRGTAEGFVPLDINKIIMTTSNMLRLRQLYENYKVVLKDAAGNTLSSNIVAAAHTGIDILLPSLEFEGIIEIYDEENELLAKKQATFYGGDMYCMGSSLQIKMNSEELNTTDPTNLGYMLNNERIVKMTIVNDNIGAATNIKLSIQQYMEKVGYTWALISLDGTNYSNEIQIDSVAAQDTRDFWVKVVKDTNFLAFEPIYFNIHLKHN
ncbi:Protein containing cell adhesion domain [Bacillus cereus]|nr:Protein containing cell adhesion domain [Bacillus cereus]